ncbi:MAG: hypothetical protein IPN95_30230 [Bacteroidetes bacterium]|nr:hypothetical protein [Bacteroidota bacterium]
MNHPLPNASDFYPGVPRSIEAIIAKATAKRPEDRFQDCVSFLDALKDEEFGENTEGKLEEVEATLLPTPTPVSAPLPEANPVSTRPPTDLPSPHRVPSPLPHRFQRLCLNSCLRTLRSGSANGAGFGRWFYFC